MSDITTNEARPRKAPHRAAYALPTLFTAGNIFLGFISILRTIQAVMIFSSNAAMAAQGFKFAAQMVGLAVILDGLDGRIARMTNTTSEFGRELDSLADIVSFGIAPAVLAYAWGFQFVADSTVQTWLGPATINELQRGGKLLSFLFLACGAARLARFNIQKNPQPRNPGSPNRKYFVGLAIPAAAGLPAAIIYALDGYPLTTFVPSLLWLALLGLLAFLMVSTWRYWSFKELNLLRPRSPVMLVAMCAFIYAIVYWSEIVLLVLATFYVGSGIAIRLGGLLRRYLRPGSKPAPEAQVG